MYFPSLFVMEFLRHWQLYQLRLNPAGIESHMLRQGHAKVSPCDAGKLRRETPAKTLQDPWFPKPWKRQLAAEHLKVWEAMLGAKVAGSPWR